jgi:cytochrome c-type biogenesis protein CcmH
MTSSLLFSLAVLVLLLGTLALLLVPLLRRRSAPEAPADETATTAVFRDHKRQIEADHASGSISAEERDTALAELVARFGDELNDATPATAAHAGPAPSSRNHWIAALAIVACLPVLAGGLYLYLGHPTSINASAAPAEPQAANAQIAAMVDTLAKRLQANPEDGEGWAMLGRSYRVLGRFELAAQAYAEAAKRLPPDPALYTDWAEALGRAQGRSLIGQPTELLNRALALDPNYQKALALSGAAASERNDTPTAMAMWSRLRAGLPNGSPEAAQVDEVIGQLRDAAPGGSGAAPPSAPAAPAAAANAPSAGQAVPNAGAGVSGTVQLDPALAARVSPTDNVFVFARNPDGPRMPLAAMKMTVADLPRRFSLTDAMAMSPSATISSASKIVIEARVSKAGDVTPRPGDLTGASEVVKAGARDVRLTIDKVLP